MLCNLPAHVLCNTEGCFASENMNNARGESWPLVQRSYIKFTRYQSRWHNICFVMNVFFFIQGCSALCRVQTFSPCMVILGNKQSFLSVTRLSYSLAWFYMLFPHHSEDPDKNKYYYVWGSYMTSKLAVFINGNWCKSMRCIWHQQLLLFELDNHQNICRKSDS